MLKRTDQRPARDEWLVLHAWFIDATGYTSGGTRSLRFATWTWHDGQPVITR